MIKLNSKKILMSTYPYKYQWLLWVMLLGMASNSLAQSFEIVIASDEIEIPSGGDHQILVKAVNTQNQVMPEVNFSFYSSTPQILKVDKMGSITSLKPGEGKVIIIGRMEGMKDYKRSNLWVHVKHSEASDLKILNLPSEVFRGQRIGLKVQLFDEQNHEIINPNLVFESSDIPVASVDVFGNITAHQKGKAIIKVSSGKISTETVIAVKKNPVTAVQLSSNVQEAITGEVVYFEAQAIDNEGDFIATIPFTFSFTGVSESPSEYASGMIKNNGNFVADVPGIYTIVAAFGGREARRTLQVSARNVTEKVQLKGHGSVSNVHTSDLWVWEGLDGRDYCVTGTWGGNGEAYFWDVTDPNQLRPIDTITVDARTINDVKVSEDGKICVISREGASNRKNGLVIIDVSNPKEAAIISTYDEGLTGGVHNVFIYKDHIYALSNSERYDIISIEDPKHPKKVGSFELDEPGHSIHDVWIEDGIAYSSNWAYGVWMVDVGNGIAGGSPSNPKPIANYAYPSGWNHAAFPYHDKKTGKFYVIAGDEAFPNGLNTEDGPTIPAGFLHFIDFTDLEHPVEVAKYEVPGAGSHNLWVEGDLLYVGNYNAGLRVVDLSGDLMGDLFKQGREIAWFLPTDAKGRIPNAPMTWGPQPHKGHVFFTDWNSGLWSVKIDIKKPKNIKVEKR
jgi:hypothetical protein